ncbi:MAG: hypothetical protein QOH99_33, partial [Frankiaceae bacterium]|nr:hypothetical protein [Frankiaceae bacterium]
MPARPSGEPVVLAHAFGARYDLPIPLIVFVVGGAAVVFLSFLLVMRISVAARQSSTSPAADRAAVGPLSPVAGTLSVLVLAFLIWVGFAGSQEVAENLLPTTVWLVAWIAVPLTCGLLGNWTRPVNPFRFLAQVVDAP